MMGDNRSNSWDSRYWDNKYVSESEIIGKAEIEYYPEIKYCGKKVFVLESICNSFGSSLDCYIFYAQLHTEEVCRCAREYLSKKGADCKDAVVRRRIPETGKN